MKRIFYLPLAIIAILFMTACAENTGTLGILDEMDYISTSIAKYQATTRSVAIGAVKADNANAYLGRVVDPETGSLIEADCAAQFFCLEDYKLPDLSQMIGNITIDPVKGDTTHIERGVVKCDSCEVRIYLKSYYGDGNNPMKLEVYELSDEIVMEENETYYTDIDLTKYVKSTTPLTTKVFTAEDYIVSESDRENSNYTKNIRIVLPVSFGQQLLQKCMDNPQALANPYRFIRELFPGFYFKISSGEGTMITTLVSTFNLYYKYGDRKDEKKVYNGVTRFAATPEVIQSTHFSNENLDELLAETEYTYLKTPAGICTEMTLPINEVFANHEADSVSRAEISLQCYNKTQDKYQLGTPSNLLMVRKQHMKDFFENNEVNDNKTSFLATFSQAYNTYTFSNIARLLAYCYFEKKAEAKKAGISESEWEAQNPDWNKVLLVPVTISTVTTNTGGSNITSVNHDMNMNSAKLIGGNNKINMQIVYSRFK